MNDGMLLQINRQRNLIPEELLKEALEIQAKERAEGKPARPLLDILAARGELNSTTVRLIRTLMHRGITDGNGGNGDTNATVVEGFHAVVESVILPPPERGASVPSKAGWPKEVLDAEGEVKNLFGQFVLVAQVGSGGSGTVYRAWDRRVSRYSGLKILHTMEPSALERFTREARIAGNLQHPSIATIYEVGEQDGRFYIAMKYIDGKPIDADPRSIPECLALIRDACRALHYAHSQGIIHRDVKPANLLVDQEDRVYVTDFGIAKQALHDQTSTLSMTGTIIGTPKYLPPEQARGEAKRADARSDVYSIGATLYTLLAGRAPFPSSNVWETLESVMKRDPPALTSLNSAISPELERIVAKAMAKDPANRFSTAGELADELDRILVQRRYSGRYGLARYLARKWTIIAAAGVLIGLLLHWNAHKFFPEESPKEITFPDRYRTAADKLMGIWESYDYPAAPSLTPAQARTNHVKSVIDPVSRFLEKNPSHIQSQILQARADFLIGMPDKLNALDKTTTDDYRVRYLVGMMKLESYLDKTTPPLPAIEGPPSVEWDGAIPPLPPGLTAEAFSVPADPNELLEIEAKKDRDAGEGLQHFTMQSWSNARMALGDYCTKRKPLPVFRKALHRANYYSQMWVEVLNQKKEAWHGTGPCRECLGSALMLALGRDNPLSDLEAVRKECGSDTGAAAIVLACIARRTVERGLDPGASVAAGEKLTATGTTELRGVLRVANLRWKALSGNGTEDEFKSALADLPARPETWMGRLARIEALISLGGRRRFQDGDFAIPLDEALKLTEQLDDESGHWKKPRILRAEALLRKGDYDGAFKEMPAVEAADIRGHLILAEAHLRKNRLQEAQAQAKLTINRVQDHPEALHFWGAAAVKSAKITADQDPASAGKEAREAVDLLSQALARIPEYTEARFQRARALFLLADYAPMSKSNAAATRMAAIADLDVVLRKYPKLAEAKSIREHLVELLKKSGTLKD